MVMRPRELGIKTKYICSPTDQVGELHICHRIKSLFGNYGTLGTAIIADGGNGDKGLCCENIMRNFLREKPIETAIEIGTYHGVSTLLLAHYAQRVITIDIKPHTEPMAVWDAFGVGGKIDYVVVRNDEEKQKFLEKEKFDFAFLDGDHTYDGISCDYELTRRCGRVLFHDYGVRRWPDVKRFVNELPHTEVRIIEPFAYWEAK